MGKGKKLEELIRNSKYKNVSQLSKVTGIPYTTIKSFIDRDLEKASIDSVIKIAKFLNVTVEELIDDDHEIQTIAAHHEGGEWTDEELDEIERFKEFVRSRRRDKR